MNILHIDTSSNKEIQVALEIDGKKNIIKEAIGEKKAQVVLPMIDKLLKKNSLTVRDLNEVTVNTGPGSFTGLRVGIAIANALGFVLQMPVNGKKTGQFVEPRYT